MASAYPKMVLRIVLAALSFAIAIVLTVFPGPAIPFWLFGFVLLGFSVGQILMGLHGVQDFLHRHFPVSRNLPTLRRRHIRRIMRQRWVRTLERLSGAKRRRRKRHERVHARTVSERARLEATRDPCLGSDPESKKKPAG
jgi:hypothetical protein